MRSRFPLGVVLILAVLLGPSSLGLNQPPRSPRAQFTLPVSDTPTFTPGAPTDTPAPSNTPTDTLPPPATTPTPSATGATPGATDTVPGPTAPPGASPTRQPNPPGEPATPSIGIRVNGCARVARPAGLDLYEGPGFNFAHLGAVGLDTIVRVTEGPQRANNLWWWKVSTREGRAGWGINDQMALHRGECFSLVASATAVASPIVIGSTAVAAGPAVTTASTATTAPAAQGQLPATGLGDNALVVAAALLLILFGVGLVRRRSHGTV